MDCTETTGERERIFAAIAACPECGADLLRDSEEWRCRSCSMQSTRGRSAFFVHSAIAASSAVRSKITRPPLWKRLLKAPRLSHNTQHSFLRHLVVSGTGVIVDIGSGERRLAPRVLNMEIAEYLNVDIVSATPRLPLKEESVDLAICQAVLEHVRAPELLVREIYRVLRPGGRCYAEVPFLQPFHADPEDYTRYTHRGLRELFSLFEVAAEGVCVGPASALASLTRELLLAPLPPGGLRTALYHLLGWLLCPLPQLDRVITAFPEARRAASGLYIVARRPDRNIGA